MPGRTARFLADDDEFDFEPRKDWNEDQPRDEKGRFGSGSGGTTHAPPPSEAPGHRVFTDKPPAALSGKQTIEEHYRNGEPTLYRRATVHDPIVKAALDGVAPPKPGEGKVAYFTMGGPGSGKSASLRNVDTTKFVKVDPDAIKEKIPEYKIATADRGASYSQASPMVHEESSDIAKRTFLTALSQGKHVLVDGTGVRADSLVSKMDVAKAAGYHVHLAFSHLDDVNEAQRRIDARADKTGRRVPRDYTETAYRAIPRNFAEIAKHADSFEVHDASKRDSPTVWSKTAEGEHIANPDFVRAFKEKYQSGRADAEWNEGDHPRDEKGRFGSGGALTSAAGKLAGPLAAQAAAGGFTYRPGSKAPTAGIMVSRAPSEDMGHVVEIGKMLDASPRPSAGEVRAMVTKDVAAWLRDKGLPAIAKLGPDHYLGGYAEHDKQTRALVALHFDVSQHFSDADRAKAIQTGRDRNQISVWDVAKMEEIPTGGTGR
jgi:predicted ABC-type ATPase